MAAKGKGERAPSGLKLAGQRLWDSVLSGYELEEHERGLLIQACHTADIVTQLRAVIDTLGVDVVLKELAEVRQQRLVYARLLAAMRLPNGLDEDSDQPLRRPQRRGAIRGVYQLGGV